MKSPLEPTQLDRSSAPGTEVAKGAAGTMVENSDAETTTNKTPDWLEAQPQERRILIETANAFLLDAPLTAQEADCTDAALGELIQERFQTALKNFYRTSGLADQIEALKLKQDIDPQPAPLDVQAANLIAQASEGMHGWVDMLPNLKHLYPESGLNCIMGSALLHCALEELGYDNVHTVLVPGHHVVVRELPDGGLTLYDPTSLSTENDTLVGYTRTFAAADVRTRTGQIEQGGRQGFAFALVSAERDAIGGFRDKTSGEKYIQHYYAYDSAIMMDAAIALENLAEIKIDAAKTEPGAEDKVFDIDAYKSAVANYVITNNELALTTADLEELARVNRQPLEELVQAAEQAFAKQTPPPNPFAYLTGPKLQPKAELTALPQPQDYAGISDRYQQAQSLVERFPQLRDLDYQQSKEQFDLFDANSLVDFPIERQREKIRPVFEAGPMAIIALGDITMATRKNLRRRDKLAIPFPAQEMRQANLDDKQRWESRMMKQAKELGETDPKVHAYLTWKAERAAWKQAFADWNLIDKTGWKMDDIIASTPRPPTIPSDIGFPLTGKDFNTFVAIRDYNIQGNTVELDTFPVTFPTYFQLSVEQDPTRSLEIAGLLGNAMILFTADGKMVVQHRSSRNRAYGDMIGASAAGNMDAEFYSQAERQGPDQPDLRAKIKPLTQESMKEHMLTELFQEDKVSPKQLSDLTFIGFGKDNRKPHYEAMWLAESTLTASEIVANAAVVKTGLEQSERHFDEKFFVLDGTPETILKLLTESMSPIPPTHMATFIATLHHLTERAQGKPAADRLLQDLQPIMQTHLAAIDAQVRTFYAEHPDKLPAKYKQQPPTGYDPDFLPQQQGLPTVHAELERLGLITA